MRGLSLATNGEPMIDPSLENAVEESKITEGDKNYLLKRLKWITDDLELLKYEFERLRKNG